MKYPRGMFVWRKVVRTWSYSPTNNPHPGHPCSLVLVLECGHEIGRKMSQGVPGKAMCYQCSQEGT